MYCKSILENIIYFYLNCDSCKKSELTEICKLVIATIQNRWLSQSSPWKGRNIIKENLKLFKTPDTRNLKKETIEKTKLFYFYLLTYNKANRFVGNTLIGVIRYLR